MNDNFWLKLNKPFFALAPMESVTDVAFRQVVALASRPDIFFTEFTNVSSLNNSIGKISTIKRLAHENSEKPIVAQIWGSNPDDFYKASTEIAKMNFSGIDINTGCPDKTVIKQGGGSALIGNFELVDRIIKSTKQCGLPISVKTRLGIKQTDEFTDWISFLLSENISNLTIHLRTRKELSKVPAHYELIPRIVELRDKYSPKTLLTINGDIENYYSGIKLANQYNIDGLMIGRGIFKNPYAFSSYIPTQTDLLNLLTYHLEMYDKYNKLSVGLPFDALKHFIKIYIRDYKNASNIRQEFMKATSTDEMRQIIEKLLQKKNN